MKKIFMSIAIIGALMVTGCTQSKEIKEEHEETIVVYCSDCGDEANKVTKFCSGCGIEAKWISEKPKIEESNKDNKETEKIDESNKDNEETEKIDEEIKNTEEVKIEKDQCHNCGKYFDKKKLKKFYEGLLCNTCYNLPKTCENGFVGLCEGCSECEPTSQYKPSDYDLYYPEADLNYMYTCINCGRTTNIYMGTIGLCEKCIQ